MRGVQSQSQSRTKSVKNSGLVPRDFAQKMGRPDSGRQAVPSTSFESPPSGLSLLCIPVPGADAPGYESQRPFGPEGKKLLLSVNPHFGNYVRPLST